MTVHTFPVTSPIDLAVRAGFGSVAVHARDGLPEASVQLAARNKDSDIVERTIVEMRGTTLHVIVPKPRGGLFDFKLLGGRGRDREALDIVVMVPAGTAAKVNGFVLDTTTTGRLGHLDLAFGAGTTELAEIAGDLRLRYGSGTSRALTVTGTALLKSGSGDISIGEAYGPVDMACGSGSLDVGVAHSSVRLRTGSGRADVEEAHGDVDLASGSGGLSFGLPAGISARLDVVTGSGQLISDLPVEDAGRAEKTIMVRARTGSGDVRIRRAARQQTAKTL